MDPADEATAKLRPPPRPRRGRHSRLRPRESGPSRSPPTQRRLGRTATASPNRRNRLARARARASIRLWRAARRQAAGTAAWRAAPSLSPSPAINPATRRGRCQRRRREAGGFAVPGRGRRVARARASPSRGFARCVVRWRARASQACIATATAHSGIRTGFGGWGTGQWAPHSRSGVAVGVSPPCHTCRCGGCRIDAWTCCRPDGWNDEMAFLADRAVLPRREEWRRSTSSTTSPVLKKKSGCSTLLVRI